MTRVLSRRDGLGLALAGLAGALGLPARAQFRSTPWPRGRVQPPLSGVDLQGQPRDLAQLRGRVVLLNFWATWCAPCKEEMPTLQTLAEIEGDALAVLAIDVNEPAARVCRYLQATGLQLPVLRDAEGDIARAWGVNVFPTTILVDPQGQARQVVLGAVDWTGAEADGWLKALRMPPATRT